MFLLIVAVLTMIIIFGCLPPSQERRHWFKPLRVYISVDDFNADDGVSL